MTRKNITGLVVCGGASSRMGQDKSLLQYHGEAQRYYIARLLRPRCDTVRLSINEAQTSERETEFPSITDLPQYSNIGPMAALLTAFHFLPQHNFLIIGCDYPLLNGKELKHFVQTIDQKARCRAFYNAADGFYEPLLAYYPAEMKQLITEQFEQGNTSLQKILHIADAAKHLPLSSQSIRSVDDVEGYEEVKKELTKMRLLYGDNQ